MTNNRIIIIKYMKDNDNGQSEKKSNNEKNINNDKQ